jgi:hypothetical protein
MDDDFEDEVPVVQRFWGHEIKAGSTYSITLTDTELHITNVSLRNSVDGRAVVTAKTPTISTPIALAILDKSHPHALLDVNFFPDDESVEIGVEGATGMSVCVAGSTALYAEPPDSEEDDEEDDVDELAAINTAKNANITAPEGKPASLAGSKRSRPFEADHKTAPKRNAKHDEEEDDDDEEDGEEDEEEEEEEGGGGGTETPGCKEASARCEACQCR